MSVDLKERPPEAPESEEGEIWVLTDKALEMVRKHGNRFPKYAIRVHKAVKAYEEVLGPANPEDHTHRVEEAEDFVRDFDRAVRIYEGHAGEASDLEVVALCVWRNMPICNMSPNWKLFDPERVMDLVMDNEEVMHIAEFLIEVGFTLPRDTN